MAASDWSSLTTSVSIFNSGLAKDNPVVDGLLANRIKDDVERIQSMQAFEKEHGIDLADFVKLES